MAQENLDANKTPAQLFASDCVICHKSTRGLTRAGGVFGLESFLREHYTASRESAAAIARYLRQVDRGPPPHNSRRTARPRHEPHGKSAEKKSVEKKSAKPGAVKKTGQAAPAGEKKGDAKAADKKKDEAKPAAKKPVEAKSAASKPAASKPPEAQGDGGRGESGQARRRQAERRQAGGIAGAHRGRIRPLPARRGERNRLECSDICIPLLQAPEQMSESKDH